MKRTIIKIDENLCTGCNLCVEACHEGAIGIKEGKAVLLRDDYCDGLGDCLPVCPTGAITFEEREAATYDEEAVKRNLAQKGKLPTTGGCPGAQARVIQEKASSEGEEGLSARKSQLRQWPLQAKLIPAFAPYFDKADILIAADCAAYAYSNFHQDFMKNKITVIACPKLDDCDYSEKLAEIFMNNDIKSVTVARMEVPCCGGLAAAATRAIEKSGKDIPLKVETISIPGTKK